ncbi:hypothetical protein D3C71_1963960 [compost metagenome]
MNIQKPLRRILSFARNKHSFLDGLVRYLLAVQIKLVIPFAQLIYRPVTAAENWIVHAFFVIPDT